MVGADPSARQNFNPLQSAAESGSLWQSRVAPCPVSEASQHRRDHNNGIQGAAHVEEEQVLF